MLRVLSLLWEREKPLQTEISFINVNCLCTKKTWALYLKIFLVCWFSMALAQNNPYAKELYFEVTYSSTFYCNIALQRPSFKISLYFVRYTLPGQFITIDANQYAKKKSNSAIFKTGFSKIIISLINFTLFPLNIKLA